MKHQTQKYEEGERRTRKDQQRMRRITTTLSQKQFGKYLSAKIFPASMGIVPVLFEKISIQQHPRKKYL